MACNNQLESLLKIEFFKSKNENINTLISDRLQTLVGPVINLQIKPKFKLLRDDSLYYNIIFYEVWKRAIKNVAWNVVGEVSSIVLWFALHHSRSANDRLLLVRL